MSTFAIFILKDKRCMGNLYRKYCKMSSDALKACFPSVKTPHPMQEPRGLDFSAPKMPHGRMHSGRDTYMVPIG